MRKCNLLICLILMLCIFCSVTPIYATDVTSANIKTPMDFLLNSEPTRFKASIPTSLLIYVTSDNDIITASEVYIKNECKAPIIVEDAIVEMNSPWDLEDFDAAYYSMPVNTTKLGLQLNNENVSSEGKVALERSNWPVLYGYEHMLLDYDAKLPSRAEATDMIIGRVIFTLDYWYNNESSVDDDSNDTPEVDLALWSWTDNGDSTATITGYSGRKDASDSDLVIPSELDGLTVTTIASDTFFNEIDDWSPYVFDSVIVPSGIVVEEHVLSWVEASNYTFGDNCTIYNQGAFIVTVKSINIGNNCTLYEYALGGGYEDEYIDEVNIGEGCTLKENSISSLYVDTLIIGDGCILEDNAIPLLYANYLYVGDNLTMNRIPNSAFGEIYAITASVPYTSDYMTQKNWTYKINGTVEMRNEI